MADFQISTVFKCVGCGKSISYRAIHARFCHKCSMAHSLANVEGPIFGCQYCGKKVDGASSSKKYCSNTCKKKSRTVRNGGTPRGSRPIIDGKRQCRKCDEWKSVEDFYESKKSPVGISLDCKECVKAEQRIKNAENYRKDPEAQKLAALRWRQRNAEKQGREYKFQKERCLTIDQQYDRVIEKNAFDAFDWWFAKKTDKQVAEWYESTGKPWLNPRLSDAESFKVQYKNDPEFNAYQKMRRQLKKDLYEDGIGDLMRSNLNRGDEVRSRKIEGMLGYSMKDLRVHLERQFAKGMNWGKFSAGEIHIDHIHPKASFDLSDPEQWKICWGLPNLRPMWAKENKQKSAKILTLL